LGVQKDREDDDMDVDVLTEIEAIKRLKARYFRFMDQKRWDEWDQVFTEDFTGVVHGPHKEIRYNGRADFVGQNRVTLATAVTVHHGHMPEIELLTPTTATGIWAMFDYVQMPQMTLEGYGHYTEEYVKEDGQWKIKSLRLTRLRVEVTPGTQPSGNP
jgi:hypothetical protein